MPELLLEYSPIILIVIPSIVTLLLFTISYRLKRKKWQAIHLSVQGSAIFYVAAVTVLLQQILHVSLLGYMSIFIIVLLAVILIYQWKKHTEVTLISAIKILGRILFLLFFILYIGLLIYLLISYFLEI